MTLSDRPLLPSHHVSMQSLLTVAIGSALSAVGEAGRSSPLVLGTLAARHNAAQPMDRPRVLP